MFEIRKDRSPQGRKKLLAERQTYLDLVAQGVGTAEACRIVGINRKTGHRWRFGRASQAGRKTTKSSAPPSRPVPARPEVSSRFLSQDERLVIADRHRAGVGVRATARELGRDPGTISRELRRNSHPGSGDYRPYAAQIRAEARRTRPKTSKIAANPELRERVQGMLDDQAARSKSAAGCAGTIPTARSCT